MRSGDQWLGPSLATDTISVTVLLKPSGNLAGELLSGKYRAPAREAAEKQTAAESTGFAAVRSFAAKYGLTIQSEDPASRRIVLSGTAQQFDNAFGIELGMAANTAGQSFRSYRGVFEIPPELQNYVTAILGLDTRQVARHAGGDQ